jgi:cell wall-associated NlpC family hydrolase
VSDAATAEKLVRFLTGQRVANEAERWLGTPFFPRMAKPGVGADCVQLALAVYKDAGVLPVTATLPSYNLDGGNHRRTSLVLEWLSTCPHLVPEDRPSVGSLLVYRLGRVEHHVGIMVDGRRLVHAVRGYGVIHGEVNDTLFRDGFAGSWGPAVTL